MSIAHGILIFMTRSTSGKPLRFVTSVYGKKYAGMLLTLLYSIHVSNPDAKVTIFWQDVSKHIRRLKEAFPPILKFLVMV